jgi:hypothetical protein
MVSLCTLSDGRLLQRVVNRVPRQQEGLRVEGGGRLLRARRYATRSDAPGYYRHCSVPPWSIGCHSAFTPSDIPAGPEDLAFRFPIRNARSPRRHGAQNGFRLRSSRRSCSVKFLFLSLKLGVTVRSSHAEPRPSPKGSPLGSFFETEEVRHDTAAPRVAARGCPYSCRSTRRHQRRTRRCLPTEPRDQVAACEALISRIRREFEEMPGMKDAPASCFSS